MFDNPSPMTPAHAMNGPVIAAPLAEFEWMEVVRRNAVWVVAFLAIIASITSVMNGFALDDNHIILNNDRVHSLANLPYLFGQTYWPPSEGASLYRPLTMVLFTLEWAIGRGSPLPFHAANIVLYALACVALFRLMRTIVDTDVALLATALFAAHPVHTEAVANVVGQAELLVALFLFIAVERYITARRSGSLSARDTLTITGCYAAALVSKEHSLVLPAMLAASELIIRRPGENLQQRVRQTAPTYVLLLLVAIAFIIVRTMVVGAFRAGGTNEILTGHSFSGRVFTMLNVTMDWLRLLVWPAQLSADYSYPRTHLATGPEITMLPGLLVIIGCALLAWRFRRQQPVVTLAMLWIAITMAVPSNLIMMTGFILAERTLFLASAAVTLLAAVGFMILWRRLDETQSSGRNWMQVLVAAVLAMAVTQSSIRNMVWKDNESLLTQTVQDVPLSSRAHWMLAEHYALSGRASAGADEMLLAVVLAPKKNLGIVKFGAAQLSGGGLCSRAMGLYRRGLSIAPKDAELRSGASQCLARLGRPAEAKAVAEGKPLR